MTARAGPGAPGAAGAPRGAAAWGRRGEGRGVGGGGGGVGEKM